MKKFFAGAFAFTVLILMGAATADAYTVWVEEPIVERVYYRDVRPVYVEPVVYSSYSSTYSSTYTVETVSVLDTTFVPSGYSSYTTSTYCY